MSLETSQATRQVPSCKVSREASAKGAGLRSEGKGFPSQPPDLHNGMDILHTPGGALIESKQDILFPVPPLRQWGGEEGGRLAQGLGTVILRSGAGSGQSRTGLGQD